jgi:hypothetical protein
MRTTRKLLISILIITMTMILFITTLFAVVEYLNNEVKGFSFSAASGDEFQISVDGINFYQTLPEEELLSVLQETRLIDITSMDGINFRTGGYREDRDAIPNEDYISFDLWMRSTEREKHVFLINNVSKEITFDQTKIGTYVVSRGAPWFARHTFLNGPETTDIVEKGSFGIYHSSEAIRISVIELNDDLNPLDTRPEETLKRFIFDPSENPERGFGATFGAYSYFFQMANYYMFPPIERPDTRYRLSELDPNNPYQALDNESWVATLQETTVLDEDGKTYYQAKIRVNVWIEGWDADTFDALDRDLVKIQLQFKIVNKALI